MKLLHSGQLGRREFLLASGAAGITGSDVRGDADVLLDAGGFCVRVKEGSDWQKVWNVSGATLRRLLGSAAVVESGRDPSDAPEATCRGSLLGRDGAVLRFTVRRLPQRTWAIQAALTPTGGRAITFSLAPLVGVLKVFVAPSPGALAASIRAVLPVPTAWPASELRLDVETGSLTLRSKGRVGWRTWPGLADLQELTLLPGDEFVAGWHIVAGSSLSNFKDLPIGERDGHRIRILDGVPSQTRLGWSAASGGALLIDGRMRLGIGGGEAELDTEGRLELGVAGGRQRVSLIGRLPDKAQLVRTRITAFTLDGAGDDEDALHLTATAGLVDGFTLSGRLSHCALRLPIDKWAKNYADLGRLDFASPTRLAFQLGDLPPPPEVNGVVRLGRSSGPGLELSLGTARLHVRRERDLVSLVFGFRKLVLEVGAGPPMLRLPDGAGTACPDPQDLPALIAEFPPQHVQEHAVARRRPDPPWAPELSAEDREAARDPARRREIFLKACPPIPTDPLSFVFKYRDRLHTASPRIDPDDLELQPDYWWLGLDLALTARARQAARETAAADAKRRPIGDIKLGLPLKVLEPLLAGARDQAQQAALLQDLLREAELRDPDHVTLQSNWRRTGHTDPVRFYAKEAWSQKWAEELPDKALKDRMAAMWAAIQPLGINEVNAAQNALDEADQEQFDASQAVEARAAGMTRLVFDLPCNQLRLHYALDTLLAWDKLTLRVSRRAERFEPGSSEAVAAALSYQGIRPGSDVRARLADVIASARFEPDGYTQIEVPSRLHLSPAADARFRVPSPLPPHGASPLWRAELREAPGKRRSLRAIGSPDFRPEAFGLGAKSPERGPTPSWLLAKVQGTPGMLFRGALDAYDRHQIVGLSSVYGLPAIPRRTGSGLLDASQLQPPGDYRLTNLDPGDKEDQAIYVPQPLSARLLTLSAHGATLDLDSPFVPPAALRNDAGDNLFEAFSVERWRSRIVLGRDILTEILYKGFLFPLGHRATLVKVTERQFEIDPKNRRVAYLSQHLYIQIGSPTKTFWASGQPFLGRGCPPASVTLVTTQTPDLVEPYEKPVELPAGYASRDDNGRLWRKDGTGLVFWPRSARGREGDVPFRMRLDRDADTVSLPLLFVDNAAAHDESEMYALQQYYNGVAAAGDFLAKTDSRRILRHRGARRRYGEERLPGDTTFETESWVLRADSRRQVSKLDQPEATSPADFRIDAALESADQPPFYPRLLEAVIRHGPAERLSGNAQKPLTVTYHSNYLEQGFTAQTEDDARKYPGKDSFLTVSDPFGELLFVNNGDRAGALGRPEQPIKCVARIGPVGTPPETEPFSASFFGNDAKLLGLISFQDLLTGAAGPLAPLLQEVSEFACDDLESVAKALLEPLRALQRRVNAPGVKDAMRVAYKDAIDALAAAIGQLESLTACDPAALATTLPSAIASLRNLSNQLERIAATPLAGVTDFSRRTLEEAGKAIRAAVAGWRNFVDHVLGDLIGTMLEAAQPWLLAVDTDWLVAAAELTQQSVLEQLQTTIQGALRDGFAATAAQPPNTLQQFREQSAADVKRRLERAAEAATGPKKAALVALADQIEERLREVEPPPLLAEFYGFAVAIRAGMGWGELSNTLAAQAAAWSRLLVVAGEACGHVQTAYAAIRAVVLPQDIADLVPCGSGGSACATHAGAWCAEFWSAVCRLPAGEGQALIGPTDNLLRDLRLAVAAVREEPHDCTPAALAGLWQRAWAAWQRLPPSLQKWLRALQTVTDASAAAARADVRRLAGTLLARLVPDQPALDAARAAVVQVVGAANEVDALFAALRASSDALRAAATDFGADSTVRLTEAIDALGPVASGVKTAGRSALDQLLLQPLAAEARERLKEPTRSLLTLVNLGYGAVIDTRGKVADILRQADQNLNLSGESRFECAVFLPTDGACTASAPDKLTVERDSIAAAAAGADPFAFLLDLVQKWKGEMAAPQVLNRGLLDSLGRAALAAVLQVIDLQDIRQQIAKSLASFRPVSVRRSYKYVLPLQTMSKGIFSFQPLDDKTLTLTATASLSGGLGANGQANTDASFTVDARLSPFDIVIDQYLALKFKAFTFGSGPGRSGKLDAPFDRVEIRPNLAFLAVLAAYLGYKSGGGGGKRNGPYIEQRTKGVGVVAGFRLGLPNFSLGNVGFANIAFDGHCELPFDGDPGEVRLGLCSRVRPFIISAAPYGGSGFVSIAADGEGTKELDVSLEFGGAGVIAFGPLDGVGRLMTGIYCSQGRKQPPTLFSTLTAGFTGSIAGFGIASSFVLTMTWQNNQMQGWATLSYSFSIGIIDVSFDIPIWRSEGTRVGGGGGGGGTTTAAATGDGRAFVRLVGDQQKDSPPLAALGKAHSPSALGDWAAHRHVFDRRSRPAGSRRTQA